MWTKLKQGIHYDLVSEGVRQWKILLKRCIHFDWCSVFVNERKYTGNNFSSWSDVTNTVKKKKGMISPVKM